MQYNPDTSIPIPIAVPTIVETDCKTKQTGLSIRVVVFATILFFLLTQPATYHVLARVLGVLIGSTDDLIREGGEPSIKATFWMTGLYFVILVLLLRIY